MVKGKTLSRIAFAISLFVSVGVICVTHAAASDAFQIQLRSSVMNPAADLSYLLDKIADGERDRSIEYLQFYEIPDADLRKDLARQGIELLRYVSGSTYFASLPHGAPFDEKLLGVLRWAGPVEAADKIHPRILDGNFAPWSRAGGDRRYLLIQFHRNTDPARWSTLVEAYGGEVLGTAESITMVVVRLPEEMIDPIAAEEAVQWIEEPLPPMDTLNSEARTAMNVDALQEAPYNLDGSGVQALIYDGGIVDPTHEDFGDRVIFNDAGSYHYHAIHVAGTVAGDGTRSEALGGTPLQWRGMAPAAEIVSYEFCCTYSGGGWLYTDPGDIEAKYDDAINLYGADIANNSIGTNTAPNGYPCEWEGDYGATAILIDTIVRGGLGEPFRIVWSAGNERGSGRCGTEYHTTAPPANAKNHFCIGAANSNDDSMTNFSSWGPTDDGRLKPDVSGPGCEVGGDGGTKSTYTGNSYSVLCGTSMSGPAVTGSAVLLIQDWRAQFDAAIDPLQSTVKALFVHESKDVHNVGPDFQFGYGIVQTKETIDRMRTGSLVEDEIAQGETDTYYLIVAEGEAAMKATLVWDDYPGTANADPVLVNDLDLVVTDSEGTRHYPWTLDPDNPADAAVRTQEDHKNNIEQVLVEAPLAGLWTINVTGAIPEGPQTYSVVFTPVYTGVSSYGVVCLDSLQYACEASVGVLVSDLDLLGTGAVDVALTTSGGDAETLTLVETVADTGIFEAEIPLTEGAAFPGDGVLQGADTQILEVLYIDADDGIGGLAVPKTDTSDVDCVGPQISNVGVMGLTTSDAVITWLTDEDSDSRVVYDVSIPPALSSESSAMTFSHSVGLAGLNEATRIYFFVESTDAAGNTTLDDNGGAYYSFITPFYIDSFTDDMEGGPGYWFHAGVGDEWELGTPTYGPSSAHSGNNCWGTDLDSTYENSVDASLVSSPIQVSYDSTLSFWHWFDLEQSNDHGSIEVSDDGGETWMSITPGGSVTGSSNGWVAAEIGLTDYFGEILIRFRLISNESTTYAGWYIDDVVMNRLAASGVYHFEDTVGDPLPGGDGDGFAEPGESVGIAVTVVGITEETAVGVTAVLSSTDPYVTITQGLAAYGDIEPGAHVAGSGPFEVTIDPSCPIGHSIAFSLGTWAVDGGPWWSDFFLHVYSVNTLSGAVTDLDMGIGIPAATVFYEGPVSGSIGVGELGEYMIMGLDAGIYTVYAGAPGYADSPALQVELPPDAEGIDFALGAPVIGVAPPAIEATLSPGSETDRTLTISNTGNVDLVYAIGKTTAETERLDPTALAGFGGAAGPDAPASDEMPEGLALSTVNARFLDDDVKVIIFKDSDAWNAPANEQILTSLEVPYDLATSADMATIDLDPYKLIIVPSDQAQGFYDTFDANLQRFDDFVSSGGVLQFNGADEGWQGGSWNVLPGGVTHVKSNQNYNYVVDTEHPIVQGVPEEFYGSYASHDYITDLPEGAHVIITDSAGEPTAVEYQHGFGVILVGGITYEHGYANGYDHGIVLANLIPYCLSIDLVVWLTIEPVEGVVEPAGAAPVNLNLNATDLPVGAYMANVVIESNDLAEAPVIVPVTLFVALGPSLEYASSIVDDDGEGESSGNGDGQPEPGETVELGVLLTNTGAEGVAGIEATLSSASESVTIVDAGPVLFPDLPAGESGAGLSDFVVAIDPECPHGTVVGFDLSITDDTGGPWADSFTMTVAYSACWDNDADGFDDEVCGGDDCDDAEPSTYPGAEELCDGIDNNCDGQVPADETDADGDGFVACVDDCDDDDSDDPAECDACVCGDDECARCARCVNPDADEVRGDGFDTNCSCEGGETDVDRCDNCFVGTVLR